MSHLPFFSILQECAYKKDLITGRRLHVTIINSALVSVSILGDYLIRLFAVCGNLLEANLIFCMIATPTVYTWQAIISTHLMHGEGLTALELYHRMRQEGIKPNNYVLTCVLKACGSIGGIEQGKLIHSGLISNGREADIVVTSTLIDMYAKCGSLYEAHKVFCDAPERDVVSCSILLAGYVQHGCGFSAIELLQEMQAERIEPDKVMLVSVLKACSGTENLELGKLCNDLVIRFELESDAVVGNTLIDMYANCDSLEDACEVFERLQNQTTVSWGVMIAGYVNHGHDFLALEVLERMGHVGVMPNKVMLLCSLKGCGSVRAIDEGNHICSQVIQSGLDLEVEIGTSLIDMYVKCLSLEDARKVFDKMPSKSVVSWGVMIAGYAECGHALDALNIFERMQQEGIAPAEVTFLCVLKVCGNFGLVEQLMQLHEQIIRSRLELDQGIGNTLIDVYGKCEHLKHSQIVFDRLENQSVVSWNTIIAGYALQGHGLHALELFERMQQEGTNPDKIICLSILKVCGSKGALRNGMRIHKQIVLSGLEGDVAVGNAIIDMYAKNLSLEEARELFDRMAIHDVVTWGTMLAGYAEHANCELAGQCLKAMEQHGLKPNGLTYSSLLSACCQLGKVNEADYHFKAMMERHAVTPTIEHVTCMVDLFAGSGHLQKAMQLLKSVPTQAGIVGWTCLLTACKTYGSLELGRQCFDRLVSVDPKMAAGYVLLTDIYADAHMWEDACRIHQMRKNAVAIKKPGSACIEARNSLQEFAVEDKFHSLRENIYANLKGLVCLLKEKGYVPHLDLLSDSPKLIWPI